MRLSNTPRQRPLGITIIALLIGIQGVLVLGATLSVLISGGLVGVGGVLSFVLLIVVGLVDLFLARGLWTLQDWAFWTTVVIEALTIIEALATLAQSSIGGHISVATNIIIPVIVLIYLFADRNVRAAFHA